MLPAELFRTNLALIDEIIGRVCRRSRVYGADAEDFASIAKLAIIDDDYALLRKAGGRSSLAAYLTVAIQRMLIDERMRTLGRFQPSTEARRIGETGLLAETLLRRDGRTIDEALPLVRAIDPAMTRETLQSIEARLPERTAKPRAVELEDDVPAAESADARAMEGDVLRLK